MKKYIEKYPKELFENFIEQRLSSVEISKKLNIPVRRIYDILKYYNIQRIDKHSILKKNDNFFDNIDSEIKAYLLGYLVADGCVVVEPKKRNGKIYSYSYRICFCSSIKDLYIIELFQQYICPNNKINYISNQKGVKYFREIQVLLKWSSRYMVEKLISYHIIPRKTYDVNFTLDLNLFKTEDLFIHFLRGFFDGDGWITKNSKSIGFVATSKPFLQQIINFFASKNLNFSIRTETSKNMQYYQIVLLGGKSAQLKFKKIIYSNAKFFLQRKFERFIHENIEVTSKIAQGLEAP